MNVAVVIRTQDDAAVRHAASLARGGRLTVILVMERPWTLVYDIMASAHFTFLSRELESITFVWLSRLLATENVVWRLVTVTHDAEAARAVCGHGVRKVVIAPRARWRSARLRARLAERGVELA